MSKLYDLLSAMCGKIKKPDWNQNDETAPDYVKNRPFYTRTVETVLVEESTVSFSELGGGIYQGKFSSRFSPTIGETYKVSWDGTVYECVCVSMQGARVIGNASLTGAGSDSGEPFLMIVPGAGEIIIGSTETSDSHTFSIRHMVPQVVQIDEKYLPDTVATKSEAEFAQTTANNALTTANNAQTTANAAKTAATNAQSTASAKFQLMRQNTVTTTTTIGNVGNSGGVVSVKGLNIAVGSTIKFTADGNISGKTVWDRPAKEIRMEGDVGSTICLLGLELSLDGETYKFVNKTTSSILTGLVIEYEKVIIPKVISLARDEGAWLPPYLIADCLYLTKESTSGSATLYRITVDDSGTLKATEVTA